MKLQLALLAPVLTLVAPLIAGAPAAAKGLTIDDMIAIRRVGNPAVSPDGKQVAFNVRDNDLEANRPRFDIWLAQTDGSGVKQLTTHPDNDLEQEWSPDGSWIYFLSPRSGSSQVWRIRPGGGEAEAVTQLPTDVAGFRVFPDGKHLVVALEVWADTKSLAESVKRDEERARSKVKARVYDQLLFRHWKDWEDGKFLHLFVWTSPEAGGKVDDARDLMAGIATDAPTQPFGGMDEISISPDGKSVAYVARVAGRENAWRTATDVFVVPTDGHARPVDVTADNLAYDLGPVFSPDGKSLALRMMKRAGFEADRARLAVLDLASRKLRVVTEDWDRSSGPIDPRPDGGTIYGPMAWSPDGSTIYTDTDNVGNHSVFAIDVATGKARVVVDKGTNTEPRVAGDRIVFSHDTLTSPAELYSVKPDGSDLRQLTHFNDARVKAITWGAYQQYSFKGAKGDTVYGYVIKPAGFTGGKVPVAFLIHGGPHTSLGNHFHYRWNPEVFAGHGYGVVMIDFHGSTGYGQAFTDAIGNDWGGAPYEDLMMGLDAALDKNPWLDRNRVAALGASYGGYMINWINGKTDRFRALVCHDGNLDERMAYFNTDELWSPEWEHGGVPWDKPEGYTKHNPIDLVKNWKTPTLVIHGGQDFRVVDTQSMATFTALQRKGVPSRFLYFPDEYHWVVKPQNTRLWHEEVLAWIDRWTER